MRSSDPMEIGGLSVPRPEYPRPQFRRAEWLCLNGEWQFETDRGDSGEERGLAQRDLQGKILAPFCPESARSGVGITDFLNAVWYRRIVPIPEAWRGRRLLLHFQAVDYDATVWVNGVPMARHFGGFTPFTIELAPEFTGGHPLTLVVRARDDHREQKPRGKQTGRYANDGCMYTRTTGIWQTVWMEPAPDSYLRRPRITPRFADGEFLVELPVAHARGGQRVRARLFAEGREIAAAETACGTDMTPSVRLAIPAAERREWSPQSPFLYDLDLELLDAEGKPLDAARSYAGLRSVSVGDGAFKLNGQPLFLRQVLDQGYWPDGILTAPSDDALRRDIELSLAAGFNGARLHQKVFEERFLYHADRLGYLVWGEFPDWPPLGSWRKDVPSRPRATFLREWLEAMARDYSHPCIIGWCPLNETSWAAEPAGPELDELTRAIFAATKAADPTRPVIDASGWAHRVPDIDLYDTHDYVQDAAKLHDRLGKYRPGAFNDDTPSNLPRGEQPLFVSEFGGAWWDSAGAESENASWGYGQRPRTVEEWFERFSALCATLLRHPEVAGYCYTQLTDVFQEKNGILDFQRRPKIALERLRAVQQLPAAVETPRERPRSGR